MDKKSVSEIRREALEKLRAYDIEGPFVYLIDLIPLIEMIWADEKAQDSEIAILEDYLVSHTEHINTLSGYKLLDLSSARQFVSKFLKKRPDPELLRVLRSFIAPVRLSGSDPEMVKQLKQSLLAACIDIASSSVLKYPYGLKERFNCDEKKCLFEIMESLEKA